MWGELGLIGESSIEELSIRNINSGIDYTWEDLLIFGSLPVIVNLPREDRLGFLKAYAEIYLEEEIRAEAISRKIGAFSRFLEMAALESGSSPNLTKLSNISGVSLPTVKEFYQILIDTLVVERVDPYLKNARKRIVSSPRYYFFDLGVRNVLAKTALDAGLIQVQKGILFEHLVILEIMRRIRTLNKNYKIYFWRTAAGAEVDCIIDIGNKVVPIEIKSSSYVSLAELKGLRIFLEDYKEIASSGYVIFLGKRKEKLTENITALPWNCL